jgi:hypothetical protein
MLFQSDLSPAKGHAKDTRARKFNLDPSPLRDVFTSGPAPLVVGDTVYISCDCK